MTALRFVPLFLFLLTPALAGQTNDDPKKKKNEPPDGLKALQHADAKVRYNAAHTLARLGPLAKFAVPELRNLLKDKDPYVRVKTAEALWKIEQTPAATLLPVLLAALRDKEAGVRAAAPSVIALFGAKAKPALPALVNALADKETDVKLAAITALGDLGPVAKDAANDLLSLSADKEFFLLEPFVGAALANMGEGAVPALTNALSSSSPAKRRLAAYALGAIGASAAPATMELVKALRYDDPATRKLAALALGRIGSKAQPALSELANLLKDTDAPVRIETALALWRITGKATQVSVLVKALSDESARVRDAACLALAAMKADAKDAVDPVAKLLGDKDLRLRAVITLGAIGPPAAKVSTELKKLTKDTDEEMQLWSAFSLWQITRDAKEPLAVMEQTLATEKQYTQTIVLLGEIGPAAARLLPTLVNLYREESVAVDRQALGVAIQKIDPEAAKKLGIK